MWQIKLFIVVSRSGWEKINIKSWRSHFSSGLSSIDFAIEPDSVENMRTLLAISIPTSPDLC